MTTSMIWSNCATFYHTFIPREYSTTTLAQHYSTALCYDPSCDDSRDSLEQLGLLEPSSDHDPIRFRSLVEEGLGWRYYPSQVWQVSLPRWLFRVRSLFSLMSLSSSHQPIPCIPIIGGGLGMKILPVTSLTSFFTQWLFRVCSQTESLFSCCCTIYWKLLICDEDFSLLIIAVMESI